MFVVCIVFKKKKKRAFVSWLRKNRPFSCETYLSGDSLRRVNSEWENSPQTCEWHMGTNKYSHTREHAHVHTHTHTPSSFDTLGSFPNLWSSKVLSLPTNNSLLPLWSVFKLVMRISALFSESDYLNLFNGRVASYTPTDDVQRSFRESVGRLNDTPGLSNIYPGKREREIPNR